MSSKTGQGRCKVCSKRNLIAHKAIVRVLRETRFSLREIEEILAQLLLGELVGGCGEVLGEGLDGLKIGALGGRAISRAVACPRACADVRES